MLTDRLFSLVQLYFKIAIQNNGWVNKVFLLFEWFFDRFKLVIYWNWESQTNQKGSHIAKDMYVCTYSNCKRSLIFDYELLNSYLFLSHIFKHRVTHKVPNFDSQSAQITLKWRNSHTYEPKFSIPKEICMSLNWTCNTRHLIVLNGKIKTACPCETTFCNRK